MIFSCFLWESKACLKLFVQTWCCFDQILKHICSITQTYTVVVYIQVYYVRGSSDVEYFIEVGRSVFSYSVNLNWIQSFVVSVARLVIWAGAGVWRVLEPWFLRMKGLPFGPKESWHAKSGFVSDRPPAGSLSESMQLLSSCYCMTLTTATTRQAILLLLVLSEAMLPWYDACSPFRGTEMENSKCVFEFVLVAASTHACICACNAAKTCTCTYVWLNLCLPVHVCVCQDSDAPLGRREEWPLLSKKLHTSSIQSKYRITSYWDNVLP